MRILALSSMLCLAAASQAYLLDTADLQMVPVNATSYTWATEGVTLNASGPVDPIYGFWPGLWVGQDNTPSTTLSWSFTSAVSQVSFYFSAMSFYPTSYDEGFKNFAVNAGTATVSLSSSSGTYLDASGVRTTVNDGRGLVTVTSTTGFTNLSFDHWNTGMSNGTVIEYLDAQPVPEPATMAALGLGLAAFARRRRR